MYKILHIIDDIDRPFESRKEGIGGGHAIIQDNVDTSIQRLEDNIEKYGWRLITRTRKNTELKSINKNNQNNQ